MLACAPSAVLVDGNRYPKFDMPAEALVGGDALSLSIAAASIIAKVTRDRIMRELACGFPVYGWERNKGYGTREHAAALKLHGTTCHHRRSFRPVWEQAMLQEMAKPECYKAGERTAFLFAIRLYVKEPVAGDAAPLIWTALAWGHRCVSFSPGR